MKPLKNTQGVDPMPEWMQKMISQPHAVIQQAMDKSKENFMKYPDGFPIDPQTAMRFYSEYRGDDVYSKIIEDFSAGKKIKIRDQRTIDNPSGLPISEKMKVGGEISEGVVRGIIKGAIRNNEDPYTFLSLALQETNLGSDGWTEDPFHAADANDFYPDRSNFTRDKDPESLVYQSVYDLWKRKKRIAAKLGKKSEEEIIQSWNGYGTISPQSNEYRGDSLYRIKLPIDFNQNPVYGKRIVDLRENVIKKNPDIVKMVEEFKKYASEKNKK